MIILYKAFDGKRMEKDWRLKEINDMNTFLNQMKKDNNITYTENGGLTHKTTNSKVLDMFAFGGAYRSRSDADVILLFKNAFEEDRLLAMKCLFYLRDVRGGQGERRFFRVAFHWLCNEHPQIAKKNLENVSEFGRWDDLIYVTEGTKCQTAAFNIIKHQLALDIQCKTPSLLAKWMPSQNASNRDTKRLGHVLANFFGMTSREYRKTLSVLRERINVLERLMSAGRWDEIEFDKIPSKAGLVYRNAFARRDILAKRYEEFAKNKDTKVNAEALYPHEIAHKAFDRRMRNCSIDDTERLMLQKYWDNLKDFYNGREENGIAVVDVSGSMSGTPMEAAVSMGAYIADKAHGPFANHFITFSAHPELVRFEGVDIVDKLNRCVQADWGMNTNVQAVFDMLLNTAMKQGVKVEDMPDKLFIFSDMEFDECVTFDTPEITHRSIWSRWDGSRTVRDENEVNSDLELIAKKWAAVGYKLPKVIFWNLNARQNRIPAIGDGFSYVSGFSPSMIDCILSGKDGWDLMVEKLMSKRYATVVA